MLEKVRIPAHVMARQVGEEMVILNLNNEKYYGLDAVGTRLWQALSSSASLEAALESLQAEYDVAPETLRQDMESILNEMIEQGLLEYA